MVSEFPPRQIDDEIYLAVIGPADADDPIVRLAEDAGLQVAKAGAILVTGGGAGVMEAACRGAKGAGGRTLGILPGNSRAGANAYLDVSIPTGMGEMRNALVVRTADGLIAVGGGYGTLSEIALALKLGKPLVGIRTWSANSEHGQAGISTESSPAGAVRALLAQIDVQA